MNEQQKSGFAVRMKNTPLVLAFGWRSGYRLCTRLLGGAAVHRCDKSLLSMTASAAEGARSIAS
jgi:hypothetical protein